MHPLMRQSCANNNEAPSQQISVVDPVADVISLTEDTTSSGSEDPAWSEDVVPHEEDVAIKTSVGDLTVGLSLRSIKSLIRLRKNNQQEQQPMISLFPSQSGQGKQFTICLVCWDAVEWFWGWSNHLFDCSRKSATATADDVDDDDLNVPEADSTREVNIPVASCPEMPLG